MDREKDRAEMDKWKNSERKRKRCVKTGRKRQTNEVGESDK